MNCIDLKNKSKLVEDPPQLLEKYKICRSETILDGFRMCLFVYIKLAGKNNINLDSPLSLGVIDNAKRQLADINEKYDEFMWEIEEARRKILASDHFFRVKYDSNENHAVGLTAKHLLFQRLNLMNHLLMNSLRHCDQPNL